LLTLPFVTYFACSKGFKFIEGGKEMGRCMLSVFTFVIIEWPREPRHAAAHIGSELIYNSSNCMLTDKG
jgi:hypothetical protein